MLDVEKIEKALLSTFATITSLTAGVTIFYSQIPEGLLNACAVIVEGDATGNEPEIPKFPVQVIGKFALRKDAMTAYSKVMQGLPIYGDRTVTVDTNKYVVISGILKKGNGGVYPVTENGTKLWYFSMNAIACIKSTTT